MARGCVYGSVCVLACEHSFFANVGYFRCRFALVLHLSECFITGQGIMFCGGLLACENGCFANVWEWRRPPSRPSGVATGRTIPRRPQLALPKCSPTCFGEVAYTRAYATQGNVPHASRCPFLDCVGARCGASSSDEGEFTSRLVILPGTGSNEDTST